MENTAAIPAVTFGDISAYVSPLNVYESYEEGYHGDYFKLCIIL